MGVADNCNWMNTYVFAGLCLRPGGTVLTEKALDICKLSLDSLIIDIGCGAGGTLQFLRERGFERLVGLDCSADMMHLIVSRMESLLGVLGQAENLPFGDFSCQGLFCECVLSLVKDQHRTLSGFHRVLVNGGFLVISDIYYRDASKSGSVWDGSNGNLPDAYISEQQLRDSLSSEGFTLLLWEDHKRLLTHFMAQMILAGADLPSQWCRCGGQDRRKSTLQDVSYFLLVAQK
jgi:arsenite methyltransferase